MEEIKPVATEQDEIENWFQSKDLAHSGKFRQGGIRCQGRKRLLSKEKFTTTVKFSIDILKEVARPVIKPQNGFEYRGQSKLMAFFVSFGVSRNWCYDQIKAFFNPMFLYLMRIRDTDFDIGCQACSWAENNFDVGDEMGISAASRDLEEQVSDTEAKKNLSSNKLFTTF